MHHAVTIQGYRQTASATHRMYAMCCCCCCWSRAFPC